MLTTLYTKEIYEKNDMISYYEKFRVNVGLLESERILFLKYLKKNEKILDIGCGTGRTTIKLFEIGYKNLIGLDISEKMIEQAKINESKINFQIGDVTSLNYPENHFDSAIFSFNGMMLIPEYVNRLKAFKEVYRVLKSEGYFIFSTPYLDNKLSSKFWKKRLEDTDFSINDFNFGDLFIEDIGIENIYVHIPLIKEIKKSLDNVGFKIVEVVERLNVFQEKKHIEELLDDNMYWIVKK